MEIMKFVLCCKTCEKLIFATPQVEKTLEETKTKMQENAEVIEVSFWYCVIRYNTSLFEIKNIF